jgi:histidyl-tRNA synthetase
MSADMDYMNRNLRVQMKHASSIGAGTVCIIGSDEMESGAVGIKDMSSGEQESVPRSAAIEKLLGRKEAGR